MAKREIVVINPIIPTTFKVTIIGDTPLLMNRFNEETQMEILEKQEGKAIKQKKLRVPEREFLNTIYWLAGKPAILPEDSGETILQKYEAAIPDAVFGFPAIAIKRAAAAAMYRTGAKADKVSTLSEFAIVEDMIQLSGTAPEMHISTVRIGRGIPMTRFRASMHIWSTEFTIIYDANTTTAERIINMINYGGFFCSIGDWRVEKGGSHGKFHVATELEMQAMEKM